MSNSFSYEHGGAFSECLDSEFFCLFVFAVAVVNDDNIKFKSARIWMYVSL